jgi:xanthine dehydrogenase accessory factor
MREVADDIERWQEDGEPVALATVIETWGSAPRGVGAKMALTPSGRIAGSVSGGCVEGAVFESGVETLETGRVQLLSFGVADETAWDVGLACGGKIDVFVESLKGPAFAQIREWLAHEEAGAVITVIQGPQSHLGRKLFVHAENGAHGTIDPALDNSLMTLGRKVLATRKSVRYAITENDLELFIDVILPPPALVMVGGAHITIALASMANTLGYRTIVIDPRRAFGSAERFPHVDRLIQAWPDEAFQDISITESTAVAMLTHDPKIDDPALKTVLPGPAFYIGALGSSRTHDKRRQRLREAGLSDELIDRIHSPIGLDIYATTPEEIAVAIMAEIVAARRTSGESDL